MSDDFETLVAHGKAVYGDLVTRSWEILVAQTDATNPAAIEATCDLQRNLVVAGAEWIALCERVLSLSASSAAATNAFAIPARVSETVESSIARQALETAPPSIRSVRTKHQRTRSQVRTDAAPSEQAATTLPTSLPQSNGTVSRRAANMPLNGQTAYRIFPLILDAAPAHVQLVAMSFNGAEWHPIAAWRRIYQQVIQSLQRSDPERFDTLATTLTMSNGKPLFSRDRTVYMAPIDAGGGWFATGQMPTELILQRLRMLVDWWDLPRESLHVEVVPEIPAPIAARPNDKQPILRSDDRPDEATPSEQAPSASAGEEEVTALSQEPQAQSLAHDEPVALDVAVPTTDDVASMDASIAAPMDEATTLVADVLPGELATNEVLDEGVLEAVDADDIVATRDEDTIVDPATDMTAVDQALEEVQIQNAETVMARVAESAPSVEPGLAEQTDGSAEQPSEETLAEVLPPVILDIEPTEFIDVEAAPVLEPAETMSEPVDDPVNGMEARITQPLQSAVPAPLNEVVGLPHVLPDAQSQATLVDEFTPPPMATPSNVRWVKTTNGTRLPLRPATDD